MTTNLVKAGLAKITTHKRLTYYCEPFLYYNSCVLRFGVVLVFLEPERPTKGIDNLAFHAVFVIQTKHETLYRQTPSSRGIRSNKCLA